MIRKLSDVDDALPLMSKMDIISRFSKRSKLGIANKESEGYTVSQMDFQDLFGIQSPRLLHGPAKHDSTSLLIIEMLPFCATSLVSDDKTAPTTLAPTHVDNADMADMFQRIEAIYI